MNRLLPAAAAVALLAAAPAAPAGQQGLPAGTPVPKDAATAKRLLLERRAELFRGRIDERFHRRRPACRVTTQPGPTRLVAGDPSADTLALFGVLRRPATAADVVPPVLVSQPLGLGDLFAGYARNVVTADGTLVTVLVGRGSSVAPPISPRPASVACVDAEIAFVRGDAGPETSAVRAEAIRQLRELRRQVKVWAGPTPPVTDIVRIFQGVDRGGFFEGDAATVVARRGLFLSGGPGGTDTSTTLTGLVPDGVASVEFSYPRAAGRGADYRPYRYPSAFRATAQVQDNVLRIKVPRGDGDALTARMTWRSVTGAVIRVVTGRSLV